MQEENSDYKKALKLCEENFSHEQLIDFLKSGDVIERQHAAIHLEKISSKDEAKILLSNLVGVDGKIREVAALKIFEFTKTFPEYFFEKENYEIFSNGTIDIDGNVCRLVILSACNLMVNDDFSKFYANDMAKIIKNALNEISKFTFRDKKYKINKQVFKIYWCLEALLYFFSYLDLNELKDILEKCIKLPEYTVREKCAKIVCLCKSDKNIYILREKLEKDENYYVKKALEY